jgi:hypothetical protein
LARPQDEAAIDSDLNVNPGATPRIVEADPGLLLAWAVGTIVAAMLILCGR